jgi:flagellar biosynthesis protein
MAGKMSKYRAAVGLSYRAAENRAPLLEIKGDELLAERIVKAAERFGIPVVENADLARALKALEAGQEIPESLFEAVAIVLNRIELKLAPKNSAGTKRA